MLLVTSAQDTALRQRGEEGFGSKLLPCIPAPLLWVPLALDVFPLVHEKKEDEVWGAEEGVMDFNLEIMTTGLYQHDNEVHKWGKQRTTAPGCRSARGTHECGGRGHRWAVKRFTVIESGICNSLSRLNDETQDFSEQEYFMSFHALTVRVGVFSILKRIAFALQKIHNSLRQKPGPLCVAVDPFTNVRN